ncbi:MAG TPA: hypothetical protein VMW56_01635 [Candidatus Margulisiibacteriota bacterium]|nr:hypothetical protein [Candidatus Margulisiibacteriota bacterium]
MRARAVWKSTVAGLAAVLFGAGVAPVSAQNPPSPFPASDVPAGYLVFPKIQVNTQPTGPADPVTETVVQLTNTSQNARNVHCFFVSGTDCQPFNFNIALSPGQPFAWQVSNGSSTPLIAGRDPFLGELKCIEVNNQNVPLPVNANDLKGEASIYTFRRVNGVVQDVDTSTYNAIGFQTSVVSTSEPPDAQRVCVGSQTVCTAGGTQCGAGSCGAGRCTSGTNDGKGCNVNTDCPLGECNALMCLGATTGTGSPCPTANYAACPDTLILNNFFDQAPDPGDANQRKITNRLTLVPCTEDLSTDEPEAITVVQFLIFNEFEQRMSTATRVQCYSDTPLSNIDTKPGGEAGSVFNVGVQGTLAGQTRIRGVKDGNLSIGQGLLAVAQEFRTDSITGGVASTAVNLNEVGLPAGKGDFVRYTPQ